MSEGTYIMRPAQVAPLWGVRFFQGKNTRARYVIQREASDSLRFYAISCANNQRAGAWDQLTRACAGTINAGADRRARLYSIIYQQRSVAKHFVTILICTVRVTNWADGIKYHNIRLFAEKPDYTWNLADLGNIGKNNLSTRGQIRL